jgi:uncharacterized protein YndB with AHSA1/START domain
MTREHSRMKSPPFRRNDRLSHRSVQAPVAIRVEARFESSAERVFNAWLDPDVAGRWLFATATRRIAHVEIDARVEGGFRFVERSQTGDVEYRGEYVEIAPHRRLVFSLAQIDRRNVATRVIVEIERQASGCSLALTHEELPVDLAYAMEARWTGMLYGLGETLDSIGGDRLAERPPTLRRGPLRRPALAERRLP